MSRPRLAAHGGPGDELWLSLGDDAFPEKGWSDKAEVVLGTWVPQLLSMIRGEGGRAVLQFMDGPYEVQIESQREFEWSVTLVVRGRAVDAGTLDGSSFGASLRTALVSVGGAATEWVPHVDKALATAT